MLKLDLQFFAAPDATGITTETAQSLMVDAGAVWLNYGLTDERMLGATRGGSSFVVEQDVREPAIDGSPGPLRGTRRVVEVRPRLTVNLLELTRENIMLALVGSTAAAVPDTTATTHQEIRRSRNIIDADYVENIALVGTIQGTDNPIIIMLENAINDQNFELGTEDREESVLEVQFTGHFDPANMAQEPWLIRYPEV